MKKSEKNVKLGRYTFHLKKNNGINKKDIVPVNGMKMEDL